jgi:hypothetical protein
MDVREIECGVWTKSMWFKIRVLVNTVIKLRVP